MHKAATAAIAGHVASSPTEGADVELSPDGLSTNEARVRLMRQGFNEIPVKNSRRTLKVIAGALKEPMFGLLAIGSVAYFLIGDMLEATILAAFSSISIGITVLQELRSEKALSALRDISAPVARVIRDGIALTIPAREVVRGDLMLLDAGDRVAADVRLAGTDVVEVDESMMTGESISCERSGTAGDILRAGTTITQGSARGSVIATGSDSAIGRIAVAVDELDVTAPRLRRETRTIMRWMGSAALLIAAATFAAFGVLRHDWAAGALTGVTLAMALLPEEFAVVVAVYLAMGVRRIARVGVLARRGAAIDTLGAVTVLCTDKTGTLTENRMSLARQWVIGDDEAGRRRLADITAQACPPASGDPIDVALSTMNDGAGVGEPIRVYPLSGDCPAVGVARLVDGKVMVAVKGAPEAILARCAMSAASRDRTLAEASEWASQGIRVLAVARASGESTSAPAALPRDNLELVGLVGLSDPVRSDVPQAIRALQDAGVRIVILTGDHACTALAVAESAGVHDPKAILGSEVSAHPEAVDGATVVARVSPQQKLEVVRRLQRRGEVVAMIGDGVNDAPALRAADIGVAMGRRGTAVARAAGDLVLIDDRFAAIPDAMALGRRIYDNMQAASEFIVAAHVPLMGMATLPLLFPSLPTLEPLHIALLEMIIDPICALVFEARSGRPDLMRRPPRSPVERLLSAGLLLRGAVNGLLVFGAVILVANIARAHGSLPDTRAAVLIALVSSLLAVTVLAFEDERPSLRDRLQLPLSVALVLSLLVGLVLWAKPLRKALDLGLPSPSIWLVIIAIVALMAGIAGLLDRRWARSGVGPWIRPRTDP